MKNFRLMAILVVIVISISAIATMCKKDYSIKITAQELKDKYAIVFPDLQYEGDEEPTTPTNGKPAAKKRSAATVEVEVVYDLSAEIVGGNLIGSVSPDAYTAGGQKFVDTTTVDGATGLWACGKYYYTPPGAGTTTSCPTEGTGYYRVYSADFVTYKVHLSYFKTVN